MIICITCVSSSASKSRPASSTADAPDDEKDKEREHKVSPATKHPDKPPMTPTKTEKEKKEKTSKKKDKSKGAAALPPVEAKPPPGPLVALGRRDKPLKRPRSVEKGLHPSLLHTYPLLLQLHAYLAVHQVLYHVCMCNLSVRILLLLYTSRLTTVHV